MQAIGYHSFNLKEETTDAEMDADGGLYTKRRSKSNGGVSFLEIQMVPYFRSDHSWPQACNNSPELNGILQERG